MWRHSRRLLFCCGLLACLSAQTCSQKQVYLQPHCICCPQMLYTVWKTSVHWIPGAIWSNSLTNFSGCVFAPNAIDANPLNKSGVSRSILEMHYAANTAVSQSITICMIWLNLIKPQPVLIESDVRLDEFLSIVKLLFLELRSQMGMETFSRCDLLLGLSFQIRNQKRTQRDCFPREPVQRTRELGKLAAPSPSWDAPTHDSQQRAATGQTRGMMMMKDPPVMLLREYLHFSVRQSHTYWTLIWISSHVRILSRNYTHRYIPLASLNRCECI